MFSAIIFVSVFLFSFHFQMIFEFIMNVSSEYQSFCLIINYCLILLFKFIFLLSCLSHNFRKLRKIRPLTLERNQSWIFKSMSAATVSVVILKSIFIDCVVMAVSKIRKDIRTEIFNYRVVSLPKRIKS